MKKFQNGPGRTALERLKRSHAGGVGKSRDRASQASQTPNDRFSKDRAVNDSIGKDRMGRERLDRDRFNRSEGVNRGAKRPPASRVTAANVPSVASEAPVRPAVAEDAPESSGYVSYRYSRQSISLSGDGRTRISARREFMHNGRMESEEFEGTLEGEDRFHDMARSLHDRFLAETDRLMAPLSHLKPQGPSLPETPLAEEEEAGNAGRDKVRPARLPLSQQQRAPLDAGKRPASRPLTGGRSATDRRERTGTGAAAASPRSSAYGQQRASSRPAGTGRKPESAGKRFPFGRK